MAASVCVDADDFYSKLEDLKEKSKSSKSNTTLYICDEFYEKAKQWLKCTTPEEEKDIALSDNDNLKIIRNKWNVDKEGRVIDAKGKYVVHKSTIHDVLSQAHKAICHRGRDETAKYLSENYSNLPKQIITLFTSICKLHQEQASLTNYCKKPVTKPIQADGFLSHLEMDLIDFRKIPCNCGRRHLWALHVEDHFSKYSWLLPLKKKESLEVAQTIEPLFWQFGFPCKLHTDRGDSLKGALMTSAQSSTYHKPEALQETLLLRDLSRGQTD
ncbi:predicted protein [Nematostella vectensis]|uniref:Integrase catalytic domain-containing protein n=1 Tax=Nematostella vectensis TaxID=45351 RepID=A7SGE3_NEMVE|nr:predicted protein [Nematostella vectensis]|eukprot:XP_001629318.1 predicted protein [Nematostella vectensis]